MNKTSATLLRLYLPASWPGQQTACEWQLLNASGVQLQAGNSEPRHWPAASHCEVLLTAEQCLLTSLDLPKAARARTPEIIGYALEEQLLGDVASEHFVLGNPLPASPARPVTDTATVANTAVWVISRSRLQTLLATLRALGHVPQRLISELQLLPMSHPDHWALCLKPGRGFLRTANEAGCNLDLADDASGKRLALPAELQLMLAAARKAGTQPAAIEIFTAPDLNLDATQIEDWQERLGLPLRLAGAYRWHNLPAQTARNLLTGDFSPPRKTGEGWDVLRPAALLGGLCLLIYSLFSLTEWAWLNHEKNRLQQQMTAQFRSSFPQAQTIVDPPLQMQRLHDQLLRERGQSGAGDFLSLLATASSALPDSSQLRLIAYAANRLELTLTLADNQQLEQLRENLTRRGLDVVIRDSRPASNGHASEALLILRSQP
ncbi:MAG: hypothetical protein KUL75_03850 [Sterolibacterium sp.]|nr:hypothetical protein [Sterolibacterium sp.]